MSCANFRLLPQHLLTIAYSAREGLTPQYLRQSGHILESRAAMKQDSTKIQSPFPASLQRRRLGFTLISAPLWLSACAGKPGRSSQEDAATMRHLGQGAFVVGASHPLSSARTILAGPHGDVLIEMQAPRAENKYPLVIYLPGLGEDIQEGQKWRTTWAQAGYAVLAIQQQTDGSAIFSSDDARSGDFAALARRALLIEARAKRVATLQFVLAQMDSLARTNEPLFARADRSNIVLAGYDLGADTALACAGIHWNGADKAHIVGLRGFIAISPRNDPRATDATAYADVVLPVLNITSDNDLDPFGLIPDATTRTAPYRAMPAGDKYMLRFRSMSHRELSGLDELPERLPDTEPEEKKASRGHGRRGSGGTNTGMPSIMLNGNSAATDEGSRGIDADSSTHARRGSARGTGVSVKSQEQTQVLQSVSLAFIESALKNSGRAREWLAADAARWSSPLADFSSK